MSSFRGTLLAKHILLTIILALNFAQLSGVPIWSGSSEAGRYLAEQNRDSGDTVRVDPLDNLNKYQGGYNITNVHYWSSTIFTSVYGLAIAVVWLLCGIIYGIYVIVSLVRAICCKKNRRRKAKSYSHNDGCSPLLILAILFTLLAITACGMALGGNKMFYSRSEKIVHVVSDTVVEATDTIYLISGAFKHIDSSLLKVGSSNRATDFLTSTTRELDARVPYLQKQASFITFLIIKGLHRVYAIITAAVSLILVFVVALLAFGVLKFRRTVYLLIPVCWILVIPSLLFFGAYFFFYNLSRDTCTALEGFERDPYNNSLSAVIPCDRLLSAQSMLRKFGKGIHDSVNKVNQNITASYGNIIQICNPFSPPPKYDYQPWNCPPTSTKIGDIPRVLRMVACPDDEVEICKGGVMIRSTYFRMVQAYAISLQKLLDVFPDMENLVHCQIIKDAFSEIVDKHCKPLTRSLHMMWGSFASLSVALMISLIIWIITAPRLQCRASSVESVQP